MATRIYTSQKVYQLKTIGNLIKDQPSAEKHRIKAQELAKIKLPKNFSFNGYDIEIVKQPYWILRKDHYLLVVIIKASKDEKELNIGDGVFEYLNPPIMVHDGTYHKKYHDSLNREIDMPNLVEDPDLALKEIITDTVRIVGK